MRDKTENGIKSIDNKGKAKAEELAYLIAHLPEQEQEKIYYMLKGFEVFGKPLCVKNN